MLIFIGAGFLLGTISEYLRAYRNRKVGQKSLTQAGKLYTESNHLRGNARSETDEILGLLK